VILTPHHIVHSMDSLNVTPDVASMQYSIQPAVEQYQGNFFSHTKCPPKQDSINSMLHDNDSMDTREVQTCLKDNKSDINKALVMCRAQLQAMGQAKLSPFRPSWAGPW
jgi:hypothetical protein